MNEQEQIKMGDLVRIKSDAEDIGHLYPARFRAFRDARMVGHIIDINDDKNDPHPIEVEFGNNPGVRESMTFWWDELERLSRVFDADDGGEG
jgi:hypothetical protein